MDSIPAVKACRLGIQTYSKRLDDGFTETASSFRSGAQFLCNNVSFFLELLLFLIHCFKKIRSPEMVDFGKIAD